MTKKDLLIEGWIGVSQLLVAARQTVQYSSVHINTRVFIIKSFKMPNFTNVELINGYGSRIRCGGWQRGPSTIILYRELFYLLLVILINNLIGKHIWPNRLNGEEYLRFLSDTLPELLVEVPLRRPYTKATIANMLPETFFSNDRQHY
jgi:hypothetical protein